MEEKEKYYLTYDLGLWEDEIFCEEFDTYEEMKARYEELEYDACVIDMWKGDKKLYS